MFCKTILSEKNTATTLKENYGDPNENGLKILNTRVSYGK
jgi:hypothetical protein